MQKQVVRFERETTIKDDICYDGKRFIPVTKEAYCKNCRVHMVTDRFLSRHFQQVIMRDNKEFPYGIYPYVIIIDTSLCNLRCRPCYSWIYWKPEMQAYPTHVDHKTLARQFRCKIEKLHDESLVKEKPRVYEKIRRPFSRLRISGGEPLFSREMVLDTNLEGNSIEFWLLFLKTLDNEFSDLILENRISLKSEREWSLISSDEKRKYFPIFLTSDNGKVRIRFDTNGWLFKDKNLAERFIGGVYDLLLRNIKIDLTFSIKGTNSHEVGWFINPTSRYDLSESQINESLEDHPQWQSMNNIIDAIRTKESHEISNKKSENIISETYFNPCGDVSLTIEKGIMNNPNERLYLYDRHSLNWDTFSSKLNKRGLSLSNTENCIYFGKNITGTAWRYINIGNFELVFKCIHHNEKPFLSFSKAEESTNNPIKHRQIKNYNDPNLKHLSGRIKIQNSNIGKKCRYSDAICDYWIEMIPL